MELNLELDYLVFSLRENYIYIYMQLWLIHVVWQKPTHCKAIYQSKAIALPSD